MYRNITPVDRPGSETFDRRTTYCESVRYSLLVGLIFYYFINKEGRPPTSLLGYLPLRYISEIDRHLIGRTSWHAG